VKLSQLKIDPEFQSKIPPLQFEEEQQLEQNIIAEGRLLNPIITWNGYILDGHTRYRILKKHGFIKFEVEEIQLANKYEALASIPKEERPAILEELKKKKSDRDDTVLERLKPNRPPPKPKPAPQKKKPTATENNTVSQAEQPEMSVQEPITESPPEEEIEPTSNAPPSFLQSIQGHKRHLSEEDKARLQASVDARYDGIRAPWKIYCIETAYELYKQYGCERYVEMLHIINEAWKGNVDSYLAGVIRGVARFISVYEGEYSRERLVQQLARTHPKTITQLAQKDTGSSANRHMRQILRIYNGASREMSLPLKN